MLIFLPSVQQRIVYVYRQVEYTATYSYFNVAYLEFIFFYFVLFLTVELLFLNHDETPYRSF